jgi:hypothetical protein
VYVLGGSEACYSLHPSGEDLDGMELENILFSEVSTYELPVDGERFTFEMRRVVENNDDRR